MTMTPALRILLLIGLMASGLGLHACAAGSTDGTGPPPVSERAQTPEDVEKGGPSSAGREASSGGSGTQGATVTGTASWQRSIDGMVTCYESGSVPLRVMREGKVLSAIFQGGRLLPGDEHEGCDVGEITGGWDVEIRDDGPRLTGCEINGRSAPSLNASVNDPNLEIECSWDGEFGSITEAKFFVPL